MHRSLIGRPHRLEVLRRHRRGELAAKGLLDVLQGDDPRGLCEGAQKRCIDHRGPFLRETKLQGNPGGIDSGHIEIAGDARVFRLAGGVDDDRPALADPPLHVDNTEKRVVQHNGDVGHLHLGKHPDGVLRNPRRCRDGRPAPLRAEGRRRGDALEALQVCRLRQDLGCNHSALAATTEPDYFFHHSSRCTGFQKAQKKAMCFRPWPLEFRLRVPKF